ncbi:phytoene desaturase family protein [Demequina pelophila]|uniref:phytoene desaturase family protein n=1 Tax=Demequina pelophila TaxID=1638984 RepID=UPI000A4F256D|nr:phytoene desaturase family protein [Demequina pelophila]
MSAPRIVVIGGGVGGLATAGLLARGGARVTLLEARDQLGGRSGRLEVDGHVYDTGPSWYLMPEAFTQFFALMGRDVERELDLIELDPRYRVFFEGEDPAGPAELLEVSADAEENWRRFDALSPGEGAAVRAYAEDAGDLYRLALERFLYTTYARPERVVSAEVVRRLPELGPLLVRSLGARIASRIRDPRLRQILGFHAVFLGSSPSRAPSLFSLMSHLDLTSGVKYPRGGMYAVIDALARVAREEGADLRTGTPVERILVDDAGLATGVALASGETIEADAVVSGADLHHTETVLLDAPHRTHPEDRWRRRDPGVSALLVLAGVDGPLPELAHHSLFFSRDWEGNFGSIAAGAVPPLPASIYVSRTTATEPGLAPPGRESLVMLVPFPAEPALGATASSRAELADYAGRAIDQVGAWAGVPGLRGRTTVHRILTPSDFETDLHAWRGGALGLEHTLAQSALLRPANVSRKVGNLLYAGSSTTPGIGVPLCLISAELVAKRLLGAVDAGPLPTPAPPGFLGRSRASGVLGDLARRAGRASGGSDPAPAPAPAPAPSHGDITPLDPTHGDVSPQDPTHGSVTA